ncbi:hypothetical protein JB92DRAFT_703561 [Gautieria morchelliformis]|nr:hypothetical protein JB92DRAFT_703561 [Gautieria morchelliformis]
MRSLKRQSATRFSAHHRIKHDTVWKPAQGQKHTHNSTRIYIMPCSTKNAALRVSTARPRVPPLCACTYPYGGVSSCPSCGPACLHCGACAHCNVTARVPARLAESKGVPLRHCIGASLVSNATQVPKPALGLHRDKSAIGGRRPQLHRTLLAGRLMAGACRADRVRR